MSGERSATVARDVWRRLEPIHSVVYFAPEAAGAFTDAGYRGFWMGYFAGRAAPLGPVGPEVVEALFYNFAGERVRRALPDAWSIAGPGAALAARRAGAGAALRRVLAPFLDGPELADAADLAAAAARSASRLGRALFAANAALDWPDDPLDVLWHAATLLREHRGDGHVALLLANGLSGRESNVFQSAAGNVPRAMIVRARDYDDGEWDGVVAGLAGRGLMTDDGQLTEDGRQLREALERRTDEVALGAYDVLDDDALDRLLTVLTPLTKAVVAGGDVPAATPMGPTFASDA